MLIKKKRIDSTAVILVGATIYTVENTTDEMWMDILEAILDYQEKEDGSVEQSDSLSDLLNLIDSESIYQRKLMKDVFDKLVESGEIYASKEDRMRVALRIVDISGIFEYDENGLVYLKGFSHPMPKLLIEAILDAHYNPNSRYTVNSLVNFWKYLVLNPDKHVRDGLFAWIKTSKFSITEEGNIIAYRNVDVKSSKSNKDLVDFVAESWSKVKRWKKSPKNYVVYKKDDKYHLVESSNMPDIDSIQFSLGNLDILMDTLVYTEEGTIYKPQHSGPYGQEIIIGKPVSMPRSECDNDPSSSCSRGLHNKSAKYDLNLGSEVIVTLVNPYNVVAIPEYDNTKFRSCEYLPISRAIIENNMLQEFEPGTYDITYNGLDTMLKDLSNKSVEQLILEGLISNEIKSDDFDMILKGAQEVINTRVIKVQ